MALTVLGDCEFYGLYPMYGRDYPIGKIIMTSQHDENTRAPDSVPLRLDFQKSPSSDFIQRDLLRLRRSRSVASRPNFVRRPSATENSRRSRSRKTAATQGRNFTVEILNIFCSTSYFATDFRLAI